VQALDARSLRRLATALERKARDNLELRAKFPGEPMKFLDNEVDLLSLVREVGQVRSPHPLRHALRGRAALARAAPAGARGRTRASGASLAPALALPLRLPPPAPKAAGSPELYPVLIDGPGLPALLGLLGHENADLVVEVVDALQEMTDAGGRAARCSRAARCTTACARARPGALPSNAAPAPARRCSLIHPAAPRPPPDAIEDNSEEAQALVAALVDANGLELLFQVGGV
jgi:nucleotide-binding universal stress UspA family protein